MFCRSAISESLFKSIKGDTFVLSEICDIVKGKQVNGEYLSEIGEYYVMNGGTEPSGYYNEYNVKANTISISEGGNSCGYVQFNKFPFGAVDIVTLFRTYQTLLIIYTCIII